MTSSASKNFPHRTSSSRLVVGPLCLLAASCLLIYSIASAPAAQAGGGMPNFGDCMKNPFAPACRGISAKRSAPTNPLADAAEEEQQALNHWRAQLLSGRKASQLAELQWLTRFLLSDGLGRQPASQQQANDQSLGTLYQLLAADQPSSAASKAAPFGRLSSAGGNE